MRLTIGIPRSVKFRYTKRHELPEGDSIAPFSIFFLLAGRTPATLTTVEFLGPLLSSDGFELRNRASSSHSRMLLTLLPIQTRQARPVGQNEFI